MREPRGGALIRVVQHSHTEREERHVQQKEGNEKAFQLVLKLELLYLEGKVHVSNTQRGRKLMWLFIMFKTCSG